MEWEWQSGHNTLFLKFSIVGPSHQLQFSTNCSSMNPFHRVQSFRNGLLDRGSLTGRRSCRKTCCCIGFSSWAAHPWSSMGCRFAFTMLRHKGQPSTASLLGQTTRSPGGWMFPVPLGAEKIECLLHTSVLATVSHSAPL